MVHHSPCLVLRILDLAFDPFPVRRRMAMNDYAKAAVTCASIAAVAYLAPRLIHLWQQQRIVDALRKPVEGTFDFTKALVELAENDDGGGYV